MCPHMDTHENASVFFERFRATWSGNTLEPPRPPIRRNRRIRRPQRTRHRSNTVLAGFFPSLQLLRYFFFRVIMSHALGAPRRNGRMLVPTPGVT